MNGTLEYKGYYGTVEFSSSDNILFGKAIGINSLISYEGESLASLKKDFESAIEDYLEICIQEGVEPEKTYRGNFNVRISPELHKMAALYSKSNGQSLNFTVEQAIKKHVII